MYNLLLFLRVGLKGQGKKERNNCFTGGQTSQVGSVVRNFLKLLNFFLFLFLNLRAKMTLNTQKFWKKVDICKKKNSAKILDFGQKMADFTRF